MEFDRYIKVKQAIVTNEPDTNITNLRFENEFCLDRDSETPVEKQTYQNLSLGKDMGYGCVWFKKAGLMIYVQNISEEEYKKFGSQKRVTYCTSPSY